MPTLGFYSNVYQNLNATEFCLQNIRKHYPDSPIHIQCDGGLDYTELCKKYNSVYRHNGRRIGYPQSDRGYELCDVIEFLDRMYKSVSVMGTDYFIMMEDDVVILDQITIQEEWHMCGQPLLYEEQVPHMPTEFLDFIEKFSDIRPKQNFYNCGGGSIFKTSTFIDNFYRIREIYKTELENIQNTIYPTIGWIDCFLCVFFLLCGKEVNQNQNLLNIWPTQKPFDLTSVESHITIVHNFKNYYE